MPDDSLALFIAGHDIVIVDATNTTRKRRDDWKSRDWLRAFKIFNTPVHVCRYRASTADITAEHREGLLDAINRMHEQWEPVVDDERS